MKLTDEEHAMRAGELGPAAQWAIEHQIKVGDYLGAGDFVLVSQAHIMADTESLGVAGVEWLERFAALPASPLEQAESLEQLRALHHGMRIRVVPMEGRSGVAVDTPQDLERVRAIMAGGAR